MTLDIFHINNNSCDSKTMNKEKPNIIPDKLEPWANEGGSDHVVHEKSAWNQQNCTIYIEL